MKKILLLLLMGTAINSYAQFPTTDSLRAFINRYIRNSAVEAFQNLRLNTALIGMTNYLDSAYGGQVVSFTAPNDTTARIITLGGDTLQVTIRGAGSGGGGVVSPSFYGSLYNKTSWANLNDFNNSATVSVVSNKLDFSGGAGTFTQVLKLKDTSYLEHWSICARVKVTERSGTSYGMGVGMQSSNGLFPVSVVGSVDFTNTGNSGLSSLYSIQGGTPVSMATSASNLSISLNDYITIITERNADTLIVSLKNATTNSAWITTTYLYKLDGSVTPQVPNTGSFAIYSYGGTFTIDSLSVNNNEIVNADYALIGDSKTAGGKVSAWNNRYGDKFSLHHPNTINLGGNADRLVELLSRTDEVIAMSPNVVLMNMGSNDIRDGRDSTDYNADYDEVVSRFTAAGIRVVHLLTFYEAAQDNLPLIRHVYATYSANDIIDTYTPLATTAGVLDADNIHLTDAGNEIVFKTILASGKVNLYASNYAGVIKRATAASSLPGGSNTQFQYNNSSVFSGTSGMVWDNTNGRIGLGKTGPTVRLDVEANTNAADGIIIKNTNAGSSATAFYRAVNDANELGQLSIFSSTHATLPNYSFFAATKSFRIGVDAGVASGGSSAFEVVTGGYSVAPSFVVGSTGTVNMSSLAGTGTRVVTANSSGDLGSTTLLLKGTTTWDPASIGANSSTSTTVTVTGAALGDGVVIAKTSGSFSNGEVYFGYVSAPNMVTIQLQNGSGGTFDISSANFNIFVYKY